MNERRLNEIEALFHDARSRPPEERAAFLESACGDDTELRAEVESLLAHGEDGPVEPSAAKRALPQLAEGPGTVIGSYKLLQQVGEGGFGVVYMAEQRRPVRRRVALKIIKLGMDTQQVIARFEAERQALALMDHPNIAKVFDAGATETGRPYFVMELVRGVPITEYCDQASLQTEERLRLFILVCRAVQHAHLKGIVHRDLKPSNILVTLHDGVPVPKVIDFGIAKATNQELTEKTVFTAFRQFIGTPEYMSPEQAEMSGLDIDTRADVYSLGVLLYELLTGTTPVDPERLRRAGYEEMQRILREEEPVRPSTRVSTLGAEASAVARHRRDAPDRLSKRLRGDLDWILLKALEKDRTRRYESASAFALDIDRHLNDEPVQASPPRRTYLMRKFVRRHRGAVLAVSGLMIALGIGVAGTVWGWLEAWQALDLAQQSRRAAEASADQAIRESARQRALAELLEDLLLSSTPWRVRGAASARVVDLLDVAAEELQSQALSTQPVLKASLAQIVGDAYLARDQWEPALAHFRLAIETLDDPSAAPLVYSRAARELDRIDAEDYFELDVGIDIRGLCDRSIEVLEPAIAAREPAVLWELFEWAHVNFLRGRHEAAAALYRHSMELAPLLEDPEVPPVICEYNLACAQARLGRMDEAREGFASAADALRRVVAGRDAKAASQWIALTEYPAVGLFLEADPPLRETVEIARSFHSARNLSLADTLWEAAWIFEDIGLAEAGYALMQETVEIARGFEENELYLGLALLDLAEFEWKRGRTAEVLAICREADPLLAATGGSSRLRSAWLKVGCLTERVVASPRDPETAEWIGRIEALAIESGERLAKARDISFRLPWWTICREAARAHEALIDIRPNADHRGRVAFWRERLRNDLEPWLEKPLPWNDGSACVDLAHAILLLSSATGEELSLAERVARRADELAGGRLTRPVAALAEVQYRRGDLEAAVETGRRAMTLDEPVRGLSARVARYEAALQAQR
ncbi:MAG: serine/threonine-protein kinase [Planctomycetota bacterium]